MSYLISIILIVIIIRKFFSLNSLDAKKEKRFQDDSFNSFDEFKKPVILYNPRVTKTSEEVEIDREGCLSFPGVWYNVYRPVEVEVEWQNMKGEMQGTKLKGYEGRCFQHELDHLNGITFDYKAEENNQ